MQDWTHGFFTELALDVWQRSRSGEDTALEVAFLERALFLDEGPRRLLDVPCGNGRHAVALAQRGHSVTGVDVAVDNEERARALAAEAGVEIEFVRGDMRNLPQGAPYAGAFCMGNSFGYFPRHETERFLSALASRLEPKGRFVLDTAAVAECLLLELHRQSFVRVDDDLLVLLECDYEPLLSRLDTRYTTVQEGRVVDTRTAHNYVFTTGEVTSMLERTGLSTVELCADPEGTPFELGAERLLLVAERR